MKKVLSGLLGLCILMSLLGCRFKIGNVSTPKNWQDNAAHSSSATRKLQKKGQDRASSSSAATGSAQKPAEPTNSIREQSSADKPSSSIPDMATFIERHNKAAVALGSSQIDPAKTEKLSWGGMGEVPGGFLYAVSAADYASGVVMFEPTYIRVTGRVSDQERSIKEYAAIAAGVTGADPKDALKAMRGLVENMEPDGYTANLGEVEFEGLIFSIEMGLDNKITQFWVNLAD